MNNTLIPTSTNTRLTPVKPSPITQSLSKASLLGFLALTTVAHAEPNDVSGSKSTHSVTVSSSAPVYYDETTLQRQAERNEFIGVSTGLLTGAIFGGPVGAVVASISALAITDSINERDKSSALSAALTQQHEAYAQLQQQYDTLLAAQWQNQQEVQVQAAALQESWRKDAQSEASWSLANRLVPVESQIQFTSGSSSLAPHYREGLATLATHLSTSPTLRVVLLGYADRRGESEANMRLSQQRVERVASYLGEHGVQSHQIESQFYGEAQPVSAEQSVEHDFFDRRVVIKVQSSDGMMTASQAAK